MSYSFPVTLIPSTAEAATVLATSPLLKSSRASGQPFLDQDDQFPGESRVKRFQRGDYFPRCPFSLDFDLSKEDV